MAVPFFYWSIAAVLILLLLCILKRGITFKHIIIAIASMGYSLLFEDVFGELLNLYYYVNPQDSLFYIVLGAILIYPAIEVIYTIFLPERLSSSIIYTSAWVLLLLAFELASLYTRTLVLTGWRVFPWSVITYILTFSWINLFFRYMKNRGL